MTAILLEWLNIILRWAHVMFGILWIGTSFFFIWLEASLKRREGQPDDIAGESWMVHGGGFFLAEKYKVAPERLPPELHWFRYEAYFTFLTGAALIVLIYYLGAKAFLIDREKIPLDPAWAILLSAGSLAAAWFIYNALVRSLGDKTGALAAALFVEIAVFTFFYDAVFSDRAAFLHVGAMIGTLMAASVFAVIIPNQKKVVADLLAGRKPDPALGRQARQRSLHNNYLTLPVVFLMLSNHYPIVFGHPWSPFIVLGIVVGGALVRHFFNTLDAGALDWTAKVAIPAAITLLIVLVMVTGYRPPRDASLGDVSFADIEPIIEKHCVSCHSARPTDENFPEAPKGVAFDTPEEIRLRAALIEQQAVLSDIMPLGNESGMTELERRMLGAWIEDGAEVP